MPRIAPLLVASAAALAPPTPSTRPALYFPGGGLYYWWQAGVVERLRRSDRDGPVCGASAGALAATLYKCGVNMDAARDLAEVTREIGRLRHHAELTSMMCLGFRNAEALAIAISEQAEPAAAEGAQNQLLHDALKLEQRQLVRDSLEALGHAQRRAQLPEGTIEECLV